MPKMRLQKFMSGAGICSRRKAEEYIEKGLVTINGEVATLGQSIDPDVDVVKYKDELIEDVKNFVYYKINKPRGVETTCAQVGNTAIVDIINIPERVFPVGRLDKNTSGLILLTNDGRLSHRLMHPSFEHEKEYVVETFGAISDSQLEKMAKGVFVIDRKTKPCTVKRIASGKFSIILEEGRNRQIRRMVEAVGSDVKKLIRIRVENIHLDKMQEGEYRPLTEKEKQQLLTNIGIWK